jgi:hypothetical protein
MFLMCTKNRSSGPLVAQGLRTGMDPNFALQTILWVPNRTELGP